MSTMESVTCVNCSAVGWTEAASINEKVKKEITCGACKCVNIYKKKPYKNPIIKIKGDGSLLRSIKKLIK